jgi:hypothetical protein
LHRKSAKIAEISDQNIDPWLSYPAGLPDGTNIFKPKIPIAANFGGPWFAPRGEVCT